MAASVPSPLLDRLTKLWRHLPLRSDVDGIILELLGRFSLEKLYCDAGNKEAYPRLVITLLSQLTSIFYFQRLSLPAENIHAGPYLGLIASWEVVLRSVEFVLLIVTDGRELLWESRRLRDKYLARFLLLALRLLTLHPRGLVTQRARECRDRFARVHKSLERVFDSYPGNKSFELMLCKELTSKLHTNPNCLGLPQRLKNELPNLTSDLYPLANCLSPPYIHLLAAEQQSSEDWLCQLLALRDISFFVVGASIDDSVNNEVLDVHLRDSCARSRDAIFQTLDSLSLPPHLSKAELTASIIDIFRVILPDTLGLNQTSLSEEVIDELELDALDSLGAWLGERQIVSRVSDADMMHGMSQVLREVGSQDDPDGHHKSTQPGLYVVNCSQCHFIGASQLKGCNVPLHTETRPPYIDLPLQSKCIQCGERITIAREVQIARRAWESLGDLEVDAGAINVARHIPTTFQIRPEPLSVDTTYGNGLIEPFDRTEKRLHPLSNTSHYTLYSGKPPTPSPVSPNRAASATSFLPSPSSPPRFFETMNGFGQDRSRQGSTSYATSSGMDHSQDPVSSQIGSSLDLPKSLPQENSFRRSSETSVEKPKRWKLPFYSSKKPPPIISGDSSSISSTSADGQKMDEISLASLLNSERGHGRGKSGKVNKSVYVHLSPGSTLVFWTHSCLEVWNVGTSSPRMITGMTTESTCILASVSDTHLAFVVGTRDQKLTLKIVNIVQPSTPAIEYRMPSKPWCKSIAIDSNQNYVALGFENAIVRFFKMTAHDQPREDRLHHHSDCRLCPSVDTLSFSSDGLALLASTRHAKTGIIQSYLWRFPFLTFQELSACRYAVPLHESEDNGISAAIYKSGANGEEGLVCITTWTQSGVPILIDSRGGHKSPIRTEASGRHGKLGNRIQCAAFSSSGQELALVNDKGHLFYISNLNSKPIDVHRIATSKELTGKSGSYAMSFATIADEECIVLAWTDATKSTGWIKRVPISGRRKDSVPRTPAIDCFTPQQKGLEPLGTRSQYAMAVELDAEHGRTELEASTIR